MPVRTVFHFPEKFRRNLKAAAAKDGKSMKDFVVENIEHLLSSHIPNDETISSFNEEMIETSSLEDLFKELDV